MASTQATLRSDLSRMGHAVRRVGTSDGDLRAAAALPGVPHGRQRLGAIAEDLAAAHLTAAGCRVVARNALIRYAEIGIAGEIDLVVLDGWTLAIVEVKAMRAGSVRGPGRAVLAVDRRKQRRLRRLARAWLATEAPPRHRSIRFDVVGVTFPGEGAPEIEWIRAAF